VRETKSAKATLAVLNKSSMVQETPFLFSGIVNVPGDLYPTQFGRPIEIIDLQYGMQVSLYKRFFSWENGLEPDAIYCHTH
jgi:hypothetical protein